LGGCTLAPSGAAAGFLQPGGIMDALGGQVQQLLSTGDFSQLVSACEDLELAFQESFTAAPTPEQTNQLGVLYAAHLLAYLLEGDLNAARFLWKRVPEAVQQLPQAALAHGVLQARWRRQFAAMFEQLTAGPWEASVQPLATEVISRSRTRLVDQVGQAYKVITLSNLAAMLGLSTAAAREECTRRTWVVDGAGNVHPVRTKQGADITTMGDEQLQRLSGYMAYLEQPQCRI